MNHTPHLGLICLRATMAENLSEGNRYARLSFSKQLSVTECC